MELAELFDQTYPNAEFHDATIENINLDYVNRVAKFSMNLCVGDPESSDKQIRETRQRGTLVFTGLVFFSIDPPGIADLADLNDAVKGDAGLWVTSEGEISSLQPEFAQKISGLVSDLKVFHYFFINNLNSYVFIGATDAQFFWD